MGLEQVRSTGPLWRPALQRLVLGDPRKVRVGGEQPELVADAKLGTDRVDGADLNAPPPGAIANLRGLEVVVAIGCQEGQGAEACHDRLLVPGTVKSLKELLIDEASGGDELAFGERSLQRADLRHIGWPVAAQRQRPDARIDEEAQSRERSRL